MPRLNAYPYVYPKLRADIVEALTQWRHEQRGSQRRPEDWAKFAAFICELATHPTGAQPFPPRSAVASYLDYSATMLDVHISQGRAEGSVIDDWVAVPGHSAQRESTNLLRYVRPGDELLGMFRRLKRRRPGKKRDD